MRYEITITGVVQGVGFRPFVAALAEELHISGSVCNSGGVVKIDAFGNEEAMDKFICRLRSSAPPAAQVKEVRAFLSVRIALPRCTIRRTQDFTIPSSAV